MRKLPSYRNPPVVEVSIGVQFDQIDWLIAPRLGLAWERFKEEFPNLEQHPPLSPEIEKLGVRQKKGTVSLKFLSADVTPRVWMLNSDGSELIQVQPDRFHRNWRKDQQGDRKYPRYADHIRPTFFASLQRFRQLLLDSGLPDVNVRQCELTYVNQITTEGGVWTDHRQIDSVFRYWSGSFADGWGDRLENAAVALRKLLRDDAGEFLGRLHVQMEPAYLLPEPARPREEQIFALTLTARGRPMTQDDAGIVKFLDLAHEEIVTTFDEVTSPAMHSVWGKE